MKKISILLFLLTLSLIPVYTYAQADSTVSTKNSDSLGKNTKETAEKGVVNRSEQPYPEKLIIVIAFFLVMITLIICFFIHLRFHRQRIGYQSIKLIGLILIFPGICILAIIGDSKILSGDTLAVLLGTIAGYVLSREDDTKEEFDKKEQEDKKKIKELEDKIKNLKDKNQNLVE